MLAEALLAAALAVPTPYYPPGKAPERTEEYARRLGTIARAIELETEEPPAGWPWSADDLAWATLAKAFHESGFRREVHAGKHRGDGGRAICLGQIQQTAWVSRTLWESLPGVELAATRRCVGTMAAILARHAARCRPGRNPTAWGMGRVFYAYGTGRCGKAPPKWAQSRAWTWWRWRTAFGPE